MQTCLSALATSNTGYHTDYALSKNSVSEKLFDLLEKILRNFQK